MLTVIGWGFAIFLYIEGWPITGLLLVYFMLNK